MGGAAQARAVELAQGRPELAELEALDAAADELPGVVPELEPLRACAPARPPRPHPAPGHPPRLRVRGREACAAKVLFRCARMTRLAWSGQERRTRPWHVDHSTLGIRSGL
jgi:hypothetical protein